MTEMAFLVLSAANPAETMAFYRAAGLELEAEEHGDGPVHFATELGPVHCAIYPADVAGRASARRSGGSVFPGSCSNPWFVRPRRWPGWAHRC